MPFTNLFTQEQKKLLLRIAHDSIQQGLSAGESLRVDPLEYAAPLSDDHASFVTLHIDDVLRGCIGHLQDIQPLVQDVAENAWAAAFKDPRFAPLSEREFEQLAIHISVLSKPEPIEFKSAQDLLQKIRPGIDGLILEAGFKRGTFLPSVWESLPEAGDFLAQLKLKAGLSADFWSDSIKISRYTTESFS